MTDKTFMKITNKDIFDEIKKMKEENTLSHEQIIEHQLKTNGRVALNRWIATTGLTITLILLGLVVNHVIG